MATPSIDLTAPRGAAAWPVALLACVLVVAAGVGAVAAARPYLKTGTPAATAALINKATRGRIATWAAVGRPTGVVTGAVFGDSVFAPLTSTTRFVTAFFPALDAVGLDVSLLDLTQPGFSAFQFYYLVDAVVSAGPPDFAVVEVNVRTFAPDWYEDPAERLSIMATGLSAAQVLPVRKALATQQVGLLTPYLLRIDQWLGMSSLFDVARNVAVHVLDFVGHRANAVLGLSVRPRVEIAREQLSRRAMLTPAHAKAWYELDYVTSPTGQVLRAFTERLRAAGVKILFVLAPVQKRRLDAFGISLADFNVSTDALRRALGATPDEWIDATSLFQASDFVDAMHLRPEFIRRMAGPIAERLASMFVAQQPSAAVPPR